MSVAFRFAKVAPLSRSERRRLKRLGGQGESSRCAAALLGTAAAGRLPRDLAAVRVPSRVSGRGNGAHPGQARGRSAGLPPPERSLAARQAAGRHGCRRPVPPADLSRRRRAPAGEYTVTVYWPGSSDTKAAVEERLPRDRLGQRFMDPKSSPLRAAVAAAPTTLPPFEIK